MNNGIKLLLVFLLSFAVGFGGVFAIKTLKEKKEDKTTVSRVGSTGGGGSMGGGSTIGGGGSLGGGSTTTGSTSGGEVKKTEEETKVVPAIPQRTISLDVKKARVNLAVGSTSYHYTVKGVQAKDDETGAVLTDAEVRFFLEDDYGHAYSSTTGQFDTVAPNQTGTYRIYAQDLTTQLKTQPSTITGCVVKTPIQKLTASELTTIFNTGDKEGNEYKLKGKFAPSVKIVSLTSGFSPKSYQEVFIAVGLEGWNVTVTSLDYDCLGQITKITLRAEQ